MHYSFFININKQFQFKQNVCGELKWSMTILGNWQELRFNSKQLKLKCSKLPINNDLIWQKWPFKNYPFVLRRFWNFNFS